MIFKTKKVFIMRMSQNAFICMSTKFMAYHFILIFIKKSPLKIYLARSKQHEFINNPPWTGSNYLHEVTHFLVAFEKTWNKNERIFFEINGRKNIKCASCWLLSLCRLPSNFYSWFPFICLPHVPGRSCKRKH